MYIRKGVPCSEIDKIVFDNDGIIVDFCEGNLIDNMLLEINGMLIATIETYENCWTSNYTIYAAKTKKDRQQIWDMWYNNFVDYEDDYDDDDDCEVIHIGRTAVS